MQDKDKTTDRKRQAKQGKQKHTSSMSMEERVTVDSVYRMFSYASLFVCLRQMHIMYARLGCTCLVSFADMLCSYLSDLLTSSSDKDYDYVLDELCGVTGDADIRERVGDWHIPPDVIVRDGLVTVYSHGVGWYVFGDIDRLQETEMWAIGKFCQFYKVFRSVNVNVDIYDVFVQHSVTKKHSNARHNKSRSI